MSIGGEGILAVIPARGGSKRLPGKNTRPLGGRPLLVYSVLVARASRYIDRVVVSSDASDIREVSRSWGADAIERPAELATDTATTLDAVRHALRVTEKDGERFGWVVLLQLNVPFRWVEQCDQAIEECATKGADGALTVDEMYLKLGRLDGGLFCPDYPPGQRKQDIAPSYRENGIFYVIAASLVRAGRLFGAKTLTSAVPSGAGLLQHRHRVRLHVGRGDI